MKNIDIQSVTGGWIVREHCYECPGVQKISEVFTDLSKLQEALPRLLGIPQPMIASGIPQVAPGEPAYIPLEQS